VNTVHRPEPAGAAPATRVEPARAATRAARQAGVARRERRHASGRAVLLRPRLVLPIESRLRRASSTAGIIGQPVVGVQAPASAAVARPSDPGSKALAASSSRKHFLAGFLPSPLVLARWLLFAAVAALASVLSLLGGGFWARWRVLKF
jgi:hypothetical protein